MAENSTRENSSFNSSLHFCFLFAFLFFFLVWLGKKGGMKRIEVKEDSELRRRGGGGREGRRR
jgi:hypothetical protein